jgi:hypothetical protein
MNVKQIMSALSTFDSQRDRSQQTQPGISEVGGCSRRLAFRMIGEKPTNKTDTHRAVIGTLLHSAVEKLVTDAHPEIVTELQVKVAGTIPGSLDLYDPTDKSVTDLKFPSLKSSAWQKDHGVDRSYRWQVHLYAAGLREVGTAVETVRIVFIPVDGTSQDAWQFEEPFSQEIADEAQQHYSQVWQDVQNGELPAPEKPASFCKSFCSFYESGLCLGITTSASEHTLEKEYISAAAEYLQARAERDAAENRMNAAKEMLRDAHGVGGGYKVSWSSVRDSSVPDMDEIKAEYLNSGKVIPLKQKAGYDRLDVKAV